VIVYGHAFSGMSQVINRGGRGKALMDTGLEDDKDQLDVQITFSTKLNLQQIKTLIITK